MPLSARLEDLTLAQVARLVAERYFHAVAHLLLFTDLALVVGHPDGGAGVRVFDLVMVEELEKRCYVARVAKQQDQFW